MTTTDELTTLLAPTAEQPLPVPRLQLVWGDEKDVGHDLIESTCYYLLVYSVDRWDIRNLRPDSTIRDAPGYAAAVMGETNCRGGKRPPLETPYRDGAHARWDSKTFGFPAYVSRGAEWKLLTEDCG